MPAQTKPIPGGETDYASPPGATLKETMESLSLDSTEISRFLELPREEFFDLLEGKVPLSTETAEKLGSLFGTGADFWIALERNFVADKTRLETRINKGADTAEPNF